MTRGDRNQTPTVSRVAEVSGARSARANRNTAPTDVTDVVDVSQRTDIPPADAPNFGDKIREAISTYLGKRGDPLDRGVTVRDLLTAGMINLSDGYKNDPANFLPISGPGQAIEDLSNTYVVDLTPPPTPTGFGATAAVNSIVVIHAAPIYTMGNGHARTRLYGASYVSGALPTFSETLLLAEFTGNVCSYPVNPGQNWRLWIKWVSNDGIMSTTPSGGVNGLSVTTAYDPATLLTALNNQISSSQLNTALGNRINLIDAPTTGLVTKVNNLETTYGSTASAATSAAAAATSAASAATAQAAAVLAQTGAVTAKDEAVTAKTSAETAASNASTSATNASNSATGAAGSAATATTQAANAANSATAAGGSATAAATSASNATTSATNAGNSATAANTAKVAAESARDAASGSASAAATSASTATTQATNAGTSASAASSSATSAATSAGSAGTSASNASTSATNAAGSATSAATSLTQVQAVANSIGSAGNALNFNPDCDNPSFWNSAYIVSISDGITGQKAIAGSDGAHLYESKTFAIDHAKRYRVSAFIRKTAGVTSGIAYLGLLNYDVTGGPRYDLEGHTFWSITATSLSTSFQRYSADIAPGGLNPATTRAAVHIILGFPNTGGGRVEFQDVRVEDITDAVRGSNLIDASWWAPGAVNQWTYNGGVSENSFEVGVDFTGKSIPLWRMQAGDGTVPGDADGGWNNGTFLTNLDRSKTYRFIVPVKRTTSAAGNQYWGTTGVCHLNTTTEEGNPYFCALGLPTIDEWYLMVGYIFPVGSTGRTNDGAGCFNASTGAQVTGGTNWTFTASSTVTHRAYQFYADAGAVSWFGTPMVHVVDGSEPPLDAVLKNTATNYAAIQTEATARASADGFLFAQYTVKLDVNGYVSGYGLASTATNAAPTSIFGVRADSFYIASPSGPGISPAMPFIVQTTATTDPAGVTIPPGVYMETAFMKNFVATRGQIGLLAVDDARVSDLSVAKLTAGSLSVGQFIRSTSYVAGTSGWAINADGSSEFSNVTVRGNVTGSTITGSTITGSTIRTAETGQRISFDSQGLLFLTGATPAGKYGSFKYGAKKYGAGVLVFFNNVAKRIPFYVQQEQDVADIHLFNRISDPTGPAEIGDLVCVGGKLKICTANGTPGTWTVVGTQT